MPLAKLTAFDDPTVELATFAKALAHPARLSVLQFLANRGEVPCMEIVGVLPLSQAACSRHINVLLKAGLLKARVDGSKVYYQLQAAALEQFCQSMATALHP